MQGTIERSATGGANSNTPATLVASQAGPSATGESTPTSRSRRRSWLFRPGSALTIVTVGFLGWWVLGLSQFIFLGAALVMALELAYHRRIHVPRGFGTWLLLLVWVVIGVALLNVDAPGAVPGDSSSRYLTWVYRLSWYLAATVAMVYVGTLRRELSLTRVSRSLAWMFLATAIGGWLGILMPTLEFRSLAELVLSLAEPVLPHGLTNSSFVSFLVHPDVVQLYAGAATDTARPSAPFQYSNIWGLNFACYLPFFVHAWMGKAAGWRRYLAPVILLAALVPAVQSLNRGLWIALIAGAVIVAVRSALAGRIRLLVVGVVGVLLFALMLVLTPLGDLITTRLNNPTSNDTRASLGIATVQSVTEGSPIVGFGTTRNVQGTFTSIAGGASVDCPQCQPPALGTQGHLWLVIFSQGVLGLFFYLSFYLRLLWRVRHIRSDAVTVGMVALSAHLITLVVYDSIGMSMIAVGIGAAYLWREEVRVYGADRESTLGAYLGLVRRHWLPVALCTVLGLGLAAPWVRAHGASSNGTVSMVLPAEPLYLVDRQLDASIDDEGAMAHSAAVLAAMSARVGRPVVTDDVFVSADPNTRILNVRYVGPGAQRTADALNAAASVILQQRRTRITDDRTRVLAELEKRQTGLTASYTALNALLANLDKTDVSAAASQFPALRSQRADLRTRIEGVAASVSAINRTAINPGTVVTPPRPTKDRDALVIGLTAGGALGLLLGLLLAYRLDSAGPRARRSGAIYRRTGIPLLWHGVLSSPTAPDHALRAAVAPYAGAEFLAADASNTSIDLARTLTDEASGSTQIRKGRTGQTAGRHPSEGDGAGVTGGTTGPPTARVVLVADPRLPLRDLSQRAQRLRAGGLDVAGVLVAEPR